jgi:putative copper export protein
LNLPPPTDLAVAALRWLEYAGLLGFVGVVVVRRLAAMRPEITWARPSMQHALAAAFIGGLAVVSIDALRVGHPSLFGIVRVAAEGVALGLCAYGHRLLMPHSPTLSPWGRGGSWVVPPGILAATALAFAGHAASVNPAAGAIFTDATHVLSAGVWAGGILVLATLRPPAGWGADEGRAMLQRFGRVAFLAFTITALTGVLRATEELRGFDDLWGTPYGLVLSLKTAGVLVMVAMSVLVWRRGFQYARAEGALVLIVLAATAVLAAFPMPPGQA